MKAVVFGYSNIGYACLQELLAEGHKVAAVVTHEDDPRENVWFHSVAQLAQERHLLVFTPDNANAPEFVNQIRNFAPDIIFSLYYRNYHYSFKKRGKYILTQTKFTPGLPLFKS